MKRPIVLMLLGLAAAGSFALRRESLRAGPGLVYWTGWSLLLVILMLTAYNARKRLSFLPLGKSAHWLGFHVYAGFLTIWLFGMHVQWRVPTGWFEGVLAVLYGLVTISGVVGLVVSRAFPKRLTAVGGEVIYERIPEVRKRLRLEAESLAMGAAGQEQSSLLAKFYLEHGRLFFEGPKHFWSHVRGVGRPVQTTLRRLEELGRYLGDSEREASEKMADLVRQKDGLDYHRALQLCLKGWLFVHIPFTWSLLLFSAVHVILVFAFSGGAP